MPETQGNGWNSHVLSKEKTFFKARSIYDKQKSIFYVFLQGYELPKKSNINSRQLNNFEIDCFVFKVTEKYYKHQLTKLNMYLCIYKIISPKDCFLSPNFYHFEMHIWL